MTREEKELAIEELQGCIIAEEHGKDGKPNGNVTCELTKDTIDLAIKALEQEPRKGHWISHREHCEMNNLIPSGLGILYWCSECDCAIDSKYFHRVNYNFCPNCGADMREVEDANSN